MRPLPARDGRDGGGREVAGRALPAWRRDPYGSTRLFSHRRSSRLSLAPFLLCVALIAVGCGSMAPQYAREARSSYISARAVLAGLQEFPSQMEELLRRGDWETLRKKGEVLIEDARDLASATFAALRTVEEKCQALISEGSRKYQPYAEKILQLVDTNERIVSAYTEFVGLSSSALEGIPYADEPQELMPILQAMDSAAARIREQFAELETMEEEAESLYREISG